MNAYLFVTNQENQAVEYIRNKIKQLEKTEVNWENNPDIITIKPNNSIKIDQIREVIHRLGKKPFQQLGQYVIVYQSDLMTVPAQNSLLKTLEELNHNQYIFLIIKQGKNLLPTITSRCQLIKVGLDQLQLTDIQTKALSRLWQELGSAGPGKKLKLIEPYLKNRPESLLFCQQMALWLKSKTRQSLRQNNQAAANPYFQALKKIEATAIQLQQNCNIKLCLDNWVLKL